MGTSAMLLLGHAGWHSTSKLNIHDNLMSIPLPSRGPWLNPAGNIWQYLRPSWLSNRVLKTYDAIIEARCQA